MKGIMKKLLMVLTVAAFAVAANAGENCCPASKEKAADKAKSECPASKQAGDKGSEAKKADQDAKKAQG